jgi:preprotein translocase subunit SecF
VVFLSLKQAIVSIYDKQYKALMIFSFVVLALSIVVLGMTYARTGEFFAKGVSLKGGITMTIPFDREIDTHSLESSLSQRFPAADIGVREITESGRIKALIVEASDLTIDELKAALPRLGVPLVEGNYSIESMGSTLGQRFFGQTMKAVLFAFVMMAIVVFLTFRSFVPSLFIILSTVSDIISTLAVVNLLGIKMSTAGIAALLMLIGYAVDNNILLTTKVLKRRTEGGTIFQRTLGATRTGFTMTACAFSASVIGLIFIESDVVKQIMVIVTIGLVFDVIYTWFQNAGILRLYMVKKYGGN